MPQPRSTFGSRRTTAALVMILGLLTAGCQGDPGAPGPSTPVVTTSADTSPSPSQVPTITAPTTPEPSPASSDGPAANIPVPEKPPLADENSVEGLEAFTEYWFELFSYGYITNDWAEFLEITDTGCGTCMNVVEGVEDHFSTGGWVAGGDAEVISFSSEFEANTAGSINSFVEVGQDRVTMFSPSGGETGESPPSDPSIDVVIAIYEEDRWIMLDFGSPEGT
ncbi:DUF6318 family protein [Arthrobacter sp. Bz4]|uniref:DUF6318 family protein n=1 Tax=Arthrobacter sp. Bz4 TaxID=2171979 RepID=UPI0010573521|nr:DUF6318 family protein [Arthrobacter sp. Bz4]